MLKLKAFIFLLKVIQRFSEIHTVDVFGSACGGAQSSQFSVEYHLIVKVCD